MSARKKAKARSRKRTTSPDFDAGLAAFKADVLPMLLQSLELYTQDRIAFQRMMEEAFAGARRHAETQVALLARIADALEHTSSTIDNDLERIRDKVDTLAAIAESQR